ncbi:hypothetical protein GCM10027291_10570 [Telluribacter humicola]
MLAGVSKTIQVKERGQKSQTVKLYFFKYNNKSRNEGFATAVKVMLPGRMQLHGELAEKDRSILFADAFPSLPGARR